MAADRAEHVARGPRAGVGRRRVGGERPVLGVDVGVSRLRAWAPSAGLAQLIAWATSGLAADLSILVDVPVEVAAGPAGRGRPRSPRTAGPRLRPAGPRRVPGPGRRRSGPLGRRRRDHRSGGVDAPVSWPSCTNDWVDRRPRERPRERRRAGRRRHRRRWRRSSPRSWGRSRPWPPCAARPPGPSTPISSGVRPATGAWPRPTASPPRSCVPTAGAGRAGPVAPRSRAATRISMSSTGPGRMMSVDDVQRLVAVAQRRPLQAARQVVIMTDVHLGGRAAPALLKTLEEPPGRHGLHPPGRRHHPRAGHHRQPLRRDRLPARAPHRPWWSG